MSDECKNCEAVGAAQAKTGDNRLALSRAAGASATAAAFESQTSSPHMPKSKSDTWLYHGCQASFGDAGNVKGYG